MFMKEEAADLLKLQICKDQILDILSSLQMCR